MCVQDDDDTAYLVYTSEDNNVMHVSQLTQDYLRVKANYARALVGLKREAPAVFKHAGTYFMLTSACTGWEPNSAEVFYSRCALHAALEALLPCQPVPGCINQIPHPSLWSDGRA